MGTVKLFVVPSVTDLDTEVLKEEALRAWLCVIAEGRAVVARGNLAPDITPDSSVCQKFQRGPRFKQRVFVHPAFREAQPRLLAALQQYAGEPKSQWDVTVGGQPAQTAGCSIRSLPDVQRFLCKARRLVQSR